MACDERDDAIGYADLRAKNLLEAMDIIKAMRTGTNSCEENKIMLEMMLELVKSLSNSAPTLKCAMNSPSQLKDANDSDTANGVQRRIESDNAELTKKESMDSEVECELASLFATVACSMIELGMTSDLLKTPLKDTLKNNPHLTFMKAEEEE